MRQRLTTEEAAQRLGLSARTLERWRAQGIGPPFIRFGRVVRYDLADLEMWTAAQRQVARLRGVA